MIGLDTLKAALRVDHTHDDDYITQLEERAVARVMGASYRAGSITEVVQGGDGPALWLAHAPDTVTSVVGREYPGGTETSVVEAAEEGFDIRGGALYRRSGLNWASDEEYVVTYTMAEASPEAVQAVESLVVLWYEKRLPDAERTEAERAILSAHPQWLVV